MNFLPQNFSPPKELITAKLKLRMLTVNDLIKDYDAVTSSIDHLQKTGPFFPDDLWPSKDLTLEQDLIDLGWHQKEFQNQSSFAYTVISLEESKCLGCVYIYPSDNPKFDAVVTMWIRESEIKNGLDEHLFANVQSWINKKWPFAKVAYPGREIGWEDYLADL
jgi:hypothetical protein